MKENGNPLRLRRDFLIDEVPDKSSIDNRKSSIEITPRGFETLEEEPQAFDNPKAYGSAKPCLAYPLGALAASWTVPMFTTLAFTGMRIGELQQLQWEDVDLDSNVIHVHRGGSGTKPKDKEDRFIPIHSRKLKPVLRLLPQQSELVFLMPNRRKVAPKKLLAYLKNLCRQCGFQNPQQYKVHTFRHFFASYCAQQNLSYKYVLEWMGHSSSAILDMCFTTNYRHALAGMNSMSFEAGKAESRTVRSPIPKKPFRKLLISEQLHKAPQKKRRGRDSNPRYPRAHRFSKPARSATPTPLQVVD